MKKLELQNFGVQELDAKEIRNVNGGKVNSGGGYGGYGFLWFLADIAWEYRNDIIATHDTISKAYKKHPQALLK